MICYDRGQPKNWRGGNHLSLPCGYQGLIFGVRGSYLDDAFAVGIALALPDNSAAESTAKVFKEVIAGRCVVVRVRCSVEVDVP